MSSFFARSRSSDKLSASASSSSISNGQASSQRGSNGSSSSSGQVQGKRSAPEGSTSSISTSKTPTSSQDSSLLSPARAAGGSSSFSSRGNTPERDGANRPSSLLGSGRKSSAAFLGKISRSGSQASLKSNHSGKGDEGAVKAASSNTTSTSAATAAPTAGQDAEEMPSDLTGQKWRPRPGHPGNLSTAQANALLSLTGLLSSDKTLPQNDEVYHPAKLEQHLLRFLRARSWNVEQARVMWNKSVEWKKSVDLDSLLEEFDFEERDKVAKAGWQMYFHKTDKLGRPIFVQDLAGLDPNVVWTVTTPDRIIRNFAVTLENAVRYRYEACTAAHPQDHLIEDNLMILDIQGLGMSTFWNFKTQLQQLLSILDENFPELSGRVQIVNAPWLFSTIWSYLRGWLPPGTVEKIDIQGADYKGVLLKFIDEGNLPKRLGGVCECKGSCEKSDEGPWKSKLQQVKEARRKKQSTKEQAAS